MHGSKNVDNRNSKEIEPKRNITRTVEHTDNKKPVHPKSNQNYNTCWSPCLSLLIFPLISEVSQQYVFHGYVLLCSNVLDDDKILVKSI